MPRPGLSSAVVSATQGQSVNVAIAVSIQLQSGAIVNVWSGVGPGPTPDGGDNFIGVGSFGMISAIEEGNDVFARGIVLTLSGFNAALVTDILGDYRQGLPVSVYLVINGTLIPAWKGRTDQPKINVNGTTASISIACENRLVEMNTSASQFRYTGECQKIFHPNDLAFDSVGSIAAQTLYWGRVPGHNPVGIPTS